MSSKGACRKSAAMPRPALPPTSLSQMLVFFVSVSLFGGSLCASSTSQYRSTCKLGQQRNDPTETEHRITDHHGKQTNNRPTTTQTTTRNTTEHAKARAGLKIRVSRTLACVQPFPLGTDDQRCRSIQWKVETGGCRTMLGSYPSCA